MNELTQIGRWRFMVCLALVVMMFPAVSPAQQAVEEHAGQRPRPGSHFIFEVSELGYCLKQERALLQAGHHALEGAELHERVSDYNARCAQFYLPLPATQGDGPLRLMLIRAPFKPGNAGLSQKLAELCNQRPDIGPVLCVHVACADLRC